MQLLNDVKAKPVVLAVSGCVATVYGTILWKMVAARMTDALDGVFLLVAVFCALLLGLGGSFIGHGIGIENNRRKIELLVMGCIFTLLAASFAVYVISVPVPQN